MAHHANTLTKRLRRAARADQPAPKEKTATELFGDARLFAVVVMQNDGTEVLHKRVIVTAIEAAKTVGGLIGSLAHLGTFAEAREIDLKSLRFTGRKLGAADLRKPTETK